MIWIHVCSKKKGNGTCSASWAGINLNLRSVTNFYSTILTNFQSRILYLNSILE